MARKRTARLAWEYFLRAMKLRCPLCGESPMFVPLKRTRSIRDWLQPLDGCPRCGYPYDREPGYFLLAIWAVNYGAASLLGIILYVFLEWRYDLPFQYLIVGIVTPCLIFNLLFVRHSKALFLAFDHFCDPHDERDDEGGGNVPVAKPPPARPPVPTIRPKEPSVHS